MCFYVSTNRVCLPLSLQSLRSSCRSLCMLRVSRVACSTFRIMCYVEYQMLLFCFLRTKSIFWGTFEKEFTVFKPESRSFYPLMVLPQGFLYVSPGLSSSKQLFKSFLYQHLTCVARAFVSEHHSSHKDPRSHEQGTPWPNWCTENFQACRWGHWCTKLG